MKSITFANGNYLNGLVGNSSEMYVFWVEDCYEPRTVLVIADDFDDAYEKFLCDEYFEDRYKVEENEIADYLPEGYDGEATMDNLYDVFYQGDNTGRLTVNENGYLVDVEGVRFKEFWKFASGKSK